MADSNLVSSLSLSDQAKTLYNQGKHEAVVHLLKDHVEKIGLDPWIYALFGYSLFVVTGKQHLSMTIRSLEVAIQGNPNQAEFYYFLATILHYAVDRKRSIEFYKTAIKLNPNLDIVYQDLAFTYLFLGQVEDMVHILRNGFKQTKSEKLLGILLQFCHYDLNTSMQEMLDYSKIFYKQYIEKYSPRIFQYELKRYDINKPHIKIGFFSCNGLTDWAGVRALCKYLDKDRFSLYGYAKVPTEKELPTYCKDIKATYVDEILENCVKWQNYGDIALEDLAQIIHDDGIDIFIDLAGTAAYDFRKEPFIGLAVRKPAPVVATWLSASGSTGADEIDYFITSKYQVLDGDDKFFTETICALDSGLFQIQLDEVMELPEIQEPPFLSNSYITFGSFHRYSKFTNSVYETWASILQKVPGSKLILKYADLDNPVTADNVNVRFEKLGITRDRIMIEGADTKFNFQNAYNKIDIALDPFPFSGGTTTIDLLYMGVPVITNMADRTSSRVCAGILMANGLGELVANSAAEYIEKAVELANDKDRIILYNQTLRDRIKNGRMKAENYAKDYAAALNFMWTNSCRKKHQQKRVVNFLIEGKTLEFQVESATCYGEDMILLDKEDDLTENSSFKDVGYTIAPFLDHDSNNKLKQDLKNILYEILSKVKKIEISLEDFDFGKYHHYVNDDEHREVIAPFQTWLDASKFTIDITLLEQRISEILGTEVTCLAPDRNMRSYAIRIIRPQSTDYNPPHRDPWLDILKSAVNIYYPIVGSSIDSSLPLIAGSHRWKESEIERTTMGATVNDISYTVPSVTGSTRHLEMIRPNPGIDEVLVFSPYLIHGGAYNFQNDLTRMSLEMRFWRK